MDELRTRWSLPETGQLRECFPEFVRSDDRGCLRLELLRRELHREEEITILAPGGGGWRNIWGVLLRS